MFHCQETSKKSWQLQKEPFNCLCINVDFGNLVSDRGEETGRKKKRSCGYTKDVIANQRRNAQVMSFGG